MTSIAIMKFSCVVFVASAVSLIAADLPADVTFKRTLIIIPSLALTSSAQPIAPEVRLNSTRVFAFGGIGYGGMTSPGETALREIIGMKDAAARLRSAFAEATPEGKCYVLAALRELNSKLFADCVAEFRSSFPERVHIMQGCLGSYVSGQEMLEAIEAGRYHDDVAKK